MKNIKIITSGTGIEKASKVLSSVTDINSKSFTEMLTVKSGESKYFSEDYLYDLDPIRNSREINFLKAAGLRKDYWKGTMSYVPGVNFFKLVLPLSHRNLIHDSVSDEDLTGWSKILSAVDKNQGLLKSLIKGLWGQAGIKDDILNTLAISNVIGRVPRVVQFFVACPTNNELSKLGELFQSCLGKGVIIRILSGQDDATNKTSELLVKSDIERCKREGKDGVVILSINMGSRSFSISETDAVILMFDNGMVGSMIQKISRALTGGKAYDGSLKVEGNVISLSLDPNRVDSVDIYIVEEAQKNKTKSESFLSVLRRIRRSINIFSIDENGDKHQLLEREDYYNELIDKFSFDKLKNSQINIIPLLNNKDLLVSLLEINSSDLSKKVEKVKQLTGKGKKYLDESRESSEESESSELEIEQTDIKLIIAAILTITKSILSIIGIDNSINDKSKSFRKILESIDSDSDKLNDFLELYGISPSVVINLLDKGVINENIIDICISRF